MKENERSSWEEIGASIKCPLSPSDCRKNEGIKEFERRIEHDTVLYIAECNFCEKKALEWGPDQYMTRNGFTP